MFAGLVASVFGTFARPTSDFDMEISRVISSVPLPIVSLDDPASILLNTRSTPDFPLNIKPVPVPDDEFDAVFVSPTPPVGRDPMVMYFLAPLAAESSIRITSPDTGVFLIENELKSFALLLS